MKTRLDAAVQRAHVFVERWAVASIATLDAPALAEVLEEVAAARAARAEGDRWAFLLARTDAQNPAVADVRAWVDLRLQELDEATRHFELSWLSISDERAAELADDDALAGDRHYLLSLRRLGRYTLSPGEERALAIRDASASTAWKALHGRTLAGLAARFDDGHGERDWSLAELLAARTHTDRSVRHRALQTAQALLEPELPLLAQCYDAIVADRLAVDALRGHAEPMEPANLQNQVEGEVVERLLAAAARHGGLGHRWFAVKAELLGLERLDVVDLLAPAILASPVSWDDGRRLALETFFGVSPTLAADATAFFDERRIDAEPRRGKSFGALCIWPSTRVPGFVLVNWSGGLHDLGMLTHELGHGTHFASASRLQTDNSFKPGFAVAEVAAEFARLRLVEDLAAKGGPLARPALAWALDSVIGAVLVQAAYARFERRAYALRAAGEALSGERLSELCAEELAAVWGDALSDELEWSRTMWAPLPHFVHERFYTYTYVFAFLIAAALVARSQEEGFGVRYEAFLAAGGSRSPRELLAMLDVDLGEPGIWDDGFAAVEDWLDRISA